MAFTDVVTVRTHAQLLDDELVSDALVAQGIADAHLDILRDLSPAHAESNDPQLGTAETEIATAYVLRSLATRAVVENRDLRTGDFRLNTRWTAPALLAQAREEEQRGWGRLVPYLRRRPGSGRFSLVSPECSPRPNFGLGEERS